MVDPVGTIALIVGSLQFVLQLKTYLLEKRKRKQELASQQNTLQVQSAAALHLQQQQYNIPPFPTSIIVYNICYHIHVYPAAHPSPLYNHIVLPSNYGGFHYFQNHTSSRSAALPSVEPPSSSPSPSYNESRRNSVWPPYLSHSSYDWPGLLGGHLEFLNHQLAPHDNSRRVCATNMGMRTGSCALSSRASSYQHWRSLQGELNFARPELQRTIAVVDMGRGNIDMFVEIGGAYFRNYRINGCDVGVFAYLFRDNLVFAGHIKNQKLEKVNKEMRMVDIRMAGVRSTNSWMNLGIYDDGVEEVLSDGTSFVQTVRGAVFGLVCGLYEDPSRINVDMEAWHMIDGRHLEIVRVNAGNLHPMHGVHGGQHFSRRHNYALFSVYSFGDGGWAAQDVLLG